MPSLAPGVYVNERDFSTYAPALGLTSLAVVGGATKGPLNTPTRVTNEGDLIRTFGFPVTNDLALQAAIQALKKCSNLLFTRIASASATAAEVVVPGTDGGTAAVKAAGTVAFNSSLNPADGDTVTLRKTVPSITVENDGVGASGNQTITLGGSGVTGRIAKTGLAGGTVSVRATGTIKLIGSALPVDADTITISDGTTTKVFEFDDDSSVGGGNIAVTIVANDPYATMANLVTAINVAAFNVSAVNVVVTRTFEFDSNSSFSGSNTPVTIGASAAATMANLISAVNGYTALGLVATDTTVTVPEMTVTAGVGGIDGNALVSKSGTNITVAGSTGGTDAIAGSSTTIGTVIALSEGTWAVGIQAVITSPSA